MHKEVLLQCQNLVLMKLEVEPWALAACSEFLGVAAVCGIGFFRTIVKDHIIIIIIFSGVTKLFPLFPIILAFANTGSVLLFAALVLSAQPVLEQPVPLLSITAFVQCSYASLLKDAGRASC